uniref:Helicase-associated domain-containing protein n=2 Tax=Emiliania huxleyi TaxID=2903 RepID=A0A7S3X0T9_EMIHU|mmetsp:Transcript_29532/g.92532  ORF Transcript_29532/g.92532 Transcript_29532/m.92532 type:complete len:199 (+) Transcript_29532:230-826(+)
MRARLARYKEDWGNADAPLGPDVDGDLGRWCKVQRQLRDAGRLAMARVDALDLLCFSWVAPSDVDDPTRADWAGMLARLAAYRDEHGDCDVKKKYQRDPALGGWVAAVRRCRSELGAARVAELDQIGFVWQSSRSCGSAWMSSFRELRAFHAVHGHSDVGAVLGDGHELARWSEAMRAAQAKEALSPKRMAHLREVGW